MDIVIAGGHGQVARHLLRRLAADGHRARGLIRDPGQADDIRGDGGEPVTFDLEHQSANELAEVLTGADAVVFAAGAGPGSGPERKRTVDLGAAVLLIEACRAARVRRYVMARERRRRSRQQARCPVGEADKSSGGHPAIESRAACRSMGAADPPDGGDGMGPYLRAKAEADQALAGSGLDHTIVRPGRLTDDPTTGLVRLTPSPGGPGGQVSRDDVAAVLVAVLGAPNAVGAIVDLVAGDTPIAEAVAAL